jgi:hypothetical protein
LVINDTYHTSEMKEWRIYEEWNRIGIRTLYIKKRKTIIDI